MCHTCNQTTDLLTWDALYNPLGRPLQFCSLCLKAWRRTLRPVARAYQSYNANPLSGRIAPYSLTRRAIRRIESAYPVRFLRLS